MVHLNQIKQVSPVSLHFFFCLIKFIFNETILKEYLHTTIEVSVTLLDNISALLLEKQNHYPILLSDMMFLILVMTV